MRPRALLARCETRCDATASDSPCCRGCRASRGGGGAITIGASDSFGFEKKWRAPVSFALAFRIRRIAEGFFSRYSRMNLLPQPCFQTMWFEASSKSS